MMSGAAPVCPHCGLKVDRKAGEDEANGLLVTAASSRAARRSPVPVLITLLALVVAGLFTYKWSQQRPDEVTEPEEPSTHIAAPPEAPKPVRFTPVANPSGKPETIPIPEFCLALTMSGVKDVSDLSLSKAVNVLADLDHCSLSIRAINEDVERANEPDHHLPEAQTDLDRLEITAAPARPGLEHGRFEWVLKEPLANREYNAVWKITDEEAKDVPCEASFRRRVNGALYECSAMVSCDKAKWQCVADACQTLRPGEGCATVAAAGTDGGMSDAGAADAGPVSAIPVDAGTATVASPDAGT
jgi:hypothetical protein